MRFMQVDSLQNGITFGLTSEQCELLLTFEMAGSLTHLAALVRRDVSVVSRSLQKIAQTVPVLEKQQGKWRLSPLGRDVNNWTRDAAASQKRILNSRTILKIASTREFAARVLAAKLPELLKDNPDTALSIVTAEDGVEKLLLAGDADLGFDCGRPEDASVRFRTVQPETFAVIASPKFLARHDVRSHKDLINLPHLQYKRTSATRMLQLSYEVAHVVATFNDIAVIREACVAGMGWAVLPVYAIQLELQARKLKTVSGWKIQDERFGVWWLRGRPSIEPWVTRSVKWLEAQKLS
ncbi:MAG: substrate-binding domain-containing protein [Deltaproteobacteria bacterium]|nr:substrate-binding domain-containing protein [Deltaproteobacteria bacterium]